MISRKLPAVAASVLLLTIVATLFAPVLFQGKILAPLDITSSLLAPWGDVAEGAKPHNQSPSDAVTQYLPYRLFAEKSLREDGYIGWNPYEMGGYSIAANTMALPGSWAMQLHRFLAFKDAWNLGIVAEFLIAGSGMLVFLRSRRIPWIPCLIGAVAFMLNAQFVIWVYHRWALSSFCWMPWLLWSAVDWKGLPDLSFRRCLLPFWIALTLMGASLQHMIFVFFACGCLFLAALPPLRGAGRETLSATAKLTSSWAAVWLLAVGMAAFTIVPQIQGYLANIAVGHIRGGIGYEDGPLQILLHILLIPARIWPWLAGDPQSMDAWKLLKSDYMSLNFIGTIPMLLAFAGLFVRSMPRAAKWLIAVGLLVPLTPLVGPLYHRVELLFILGAAWMLAEMLRGSPKSPANSSPLSEEINNQQSTINNRQSPSPPSLSSQSSISHLPSPSSLPSRVIQFCVSLRWQRLLITTVAAIGLGLLAATLIPSSIRGKLEQTVVSKALAKSADSQFGADQGWIAARATEWTRRFSLTHPRTAWVYGLLVLGSAGLVLFSSSGNRQSTTNNRKFDFTVTPNRQTTGHLLILAATTLELSTLFHSWTTFSDPAQLRPPHHAIDTIRTLAGPHRVLQRTPDADFAEIFATPNLLASFSIPSIDAYESIQYRSPITALSGESPELQLALAGVSVAVHPSEKPAPAGTEAWTESALDPGYTLRNNPATPPPIAAGNGPLPLSPQAIYASLTQASPMTPTLHTSNRLTISLSPVNQKSTINHPQSEIPSSISLSPTNQKSTIPNPPPAPPTWLRISQNWHPGWKWKTGDGPWQPFHNGADAACWITDLPAETRQIQVQFFPRPTWLAPGSLLAAILSLCIAVILTSKVGQNSKGLESQ